MKQGENLQASSLDEGRYRLLVEAITDHAIYMLDPEGIIASWNAGAERLKGYRSWEVLGQHLSTFYTEEDRRANLPQHELETALREGRFESHGWRVRRDGQRFWAHIVIDPIRDSLGTLLGFAKITRDLTEQKQAEEALRRSEEQFRLLVQGVTDYAIYMLDPRGFITSWNVGAQRIKGYSPDEIIGQHFSRFYIDEDRAGGEPQRALETAAREGRFEKEALRVRRDGSHFWAHVIIDAIRDEAGELIGFAKVTRDVTERVAAQKALEETRNALFQSQKTEAIGQLTGGIAHDFNNLLMVVLGSLELLKKKLPDDPALMRLLENAVQGAQRGTALTQRMLAFARRQELKLEPVDIGALVTGMRELLQRSIGPAITLELEFPPNLPPALTDANQIDAALLNLVVNARDAMPDGGTIRVAARAEAVSQVDTNGLKAGRYLCLTVTDQGEGMDEEVLTRATDPFFTTKGLGKGTGLGLSMVQGSAEQSGGRLLLKSRKGEGTTAELWLPVAEGQTSPLSVEPVEAPAAVARRLHVLAVDDDALVLMNTVAMLEDLGHEALQATSAERALHILEGGERVDLVITDQAMPYMTGLQLTAAVKATHPKLPVILATGYAEMSASIEDQPLLKLAKPFSQAELAKAIAAAVTASR
ncbi:histidine kinase [Agaricicola taiwanensis]|uniref:histidine kinase n=1 Tax=Agaricicola taiwanensis TaxID=591372 RepID=A0A8J2YFD8_9RHOB|nr:PAS domain-containing sensor histidine kinase [Agaricicola taiwanensis]GGE29414.1 histidine kinase [Agaricicola taiwanensis]